MLNNLIDFQIVNNQFILIKKITLSTKIIEESLRAYPYRGQKRIKDDVVENYRLPSIAQVFYSFVLMNQIPSPETLCQAYIHTHFIVQKHNQCQLKGTNQQFLLDSIKARVYRTYPSLIRDLHFYFLCKESGEFDEVIYSFSADIYDGIDLKVIYNEREFAISLYVSTPRSKEFKQKKYGRHQPLSIPEICIEIDPFNPKYYVGDYALYQKEHVLLLKQKMMEHLKSAS